MEIIQLLAKAWDWCLRLIHWGHAKALKAMENRIQRFMEEAQKRGKAGVGYELEMLEDDGAFEVKDRDIAKEAIEILLVKES